MISIWSLSIWFRDKKNDKRMRQMAIKDNLHTYTCLIQHINDLKQFFIKMQQLTSAYYSCFFSSLTHLHSYTHSHFVDICI